MRIKLREERFGVAGFEGVRMVSNNPLPLFSHQ